MTTTKTTSRGARPLYAQQCLLFMTLDPVHIGAGGYRLGRVDMTIAREPGTNLPKIPGTSLAGAARSYAAMRYGKPDVAGRHTLYTGGRSTCPIIYTFGTSTDTSSKEQWNQAGTVSIGDAHILFFPVNSLAGPVWVSTVDKVREAWGKNTVTVSQEPTDSTVLTSMDWNKELNLGWLLFAATKGVTIAPPKGIDEWSAIEDRIVLVTPKLFSQIVNSNLEVRTSVSIDPTTGAAESGALFTYEAIPRTTWLWSDVIEDDYRTNGDGASAFLPISRQCKIERNEKGEKLYKENEGTSLGETWNRPLDVVKAGMHLIEYLGVGGMGTRGFGRMRLVGEWEVSNGGAR